MLDEFGDCVIYNEKKKDNCIQACLTDMCRYDIAYILVIENEDKDNEIQTEIPLTAEQCRELSKHLNYLADRLEGKS